MNNFLTHLQSLAVRGLKPVVVGSLLLGLAATPAFAQDKEPKKELSDKIAEAINGPIKNAKDAKNWNEVIRLEDKLLAETAPTSYDRAVLVVDKAQTYMQNNKLSEAIAPLEEALKLSDAYGYFDPSINLEMVFSLTQLYGAEAQNSKKPEDQRRLFAKAYNYVRRWLDNSKTPNVDMEQLAASILLGQATVNPEKVDLGLVKQAEAEIEKGMRMSVKPAEAFYVYLLAAYQQQGDYKKSADLLELLVKRSPNNKQYWSQLAQTYLQLAQGESESSLDYSVRAILAMERAQQYGAMTTPKDNYALAATYYNIKQYDRAAELLENGLKNGSIENDQKNWTLLASAYQVLHKEMKAIDALKEGSRRFPKNGELDLQIGNLYYSLDRGPDAYNYIKTALAKGVSKPAQAYFFLSYLAFDMKKLDEALDAIQKAVKLDPHSKDANRLQGVIKDAIRERDALKTQSA
jgi:tetratricopeptide (TPR) repeat protein